jgi:hypothetical protein
MSSAFLALLLGLGQGLLHGLGPDHCAAIATLGSMGERRASTVLKVAVRFALGHAAVLGALAAFCLLAGVGLSAAFERWTEILGGALLIALALAALLMPGALRHGHPHLPGHAEDHLHTRVSTAAGAVMAVSGVRALLLALPPLLVGGSLHLAAWTYLPGFALGVMAGMGAVGLCFSYGLSRVGDHAARRLERAVALGTAALGFTWIAARL